jgi:hypothetical protein
LREHDKNYSSLLYAMSTEETASTRETHLQVSIRAPE